MSNFQNFIVTTTFHEPQFKLKTLITKCLPFIRENFSTVVVCCTPTTGENVIAFLEQEEFNVLVSNVDTQVGTYKQAIKAALEYVENEKTQKLFCIDFDRFLHWIDKYPDELKQTLNRAKGFEFVHIGRTPRAFETHPETQIDTESIINQVGTLVLELEKTRDVMSPTFLMTKSLAEKLLEVVHLTSVGFYCTWPIILWNFAKSKRYIAVEGQEWETPDRFKTQIKKSGFESWSNRFQSKKEWQKRVRFLREAFIELSNIIEIKFIEPELIDQTSETLNE